MVPAVPKVLLRDSGEGRSYDISRVISIILRDADFLRDTRHVNYDELNYSFIFFRKQYLWRVNLSLLVGLTLFSPYNSDSI